MGRVERIGRADSDAYMASVRTDPENREPNDFYPTHPGATKALLSVESFDGPIWEPACGEGDITRVLEESGFDVRSTDLIDRGFGEVGRDFLLATEPHAPNIITNPPFKLATEFVERALALTTGKVAMFLRLAFLEGIERGAKFQRQPLARVWVMSRRVPMWRGEVRDEIGSLMAMAWFVWEHGHEGAPTIGWLDWQRIEDAQRQGSLFGESSMSASDIPQLSHSSPEHMARSLVTYIADTDRVFRLVHAEFGTSPCHATIKALRASHLRPVVHSAPYRPYEGYNPTDAGKIAEKASSTFLALLRAAHPERFPVHE